MPKKKYFQNALFWPLRYPRLLHLTQPLTHKDYKVMPDKVHLPEGLHSCRNQEAPTTLHDSQHQYLFTITWKKVLCN